MYKYINFNNNFKLLIKSSEMEVTLVDSNPCVSISDRASLSHIIIDQTFAFVCCYG